VIYAAEARYTAVTGEGTVIIRIVTDFGGGLTDFTAYKNFNGREIYQSGEFITYGYLSKNGKKVYVSVMSPESGKGEEFLDDIG